MNTLTLGPKFVAHIKTVESPEVYEMKLDEKSLPACIESVCTFFKVKKVADFAMLKISILVEGIENNVYSWPNDGTPVSKDVTTVKVAPKRALVNYRVVMWKYDTKGPLVEDIASISPERARDAGLRIHGITTVSAAKRIIVYGPPDNKNSRQVLLSYGLAVHSVDEKPSTVELPPEKPARVYTEKKYAAKMYGIFKDDYKPN